MRLRTFAVMLIMASSVPVHMDVSEGTPAFLQHHPRRRATTTAEPDFFAETDNLSSEPSSVPKTAKTRETKRNAEETPDTSDTQADGSAEPAHLSDGMVELCKKPSFQVVLNPAKNSRELRFGEDAKAATRSKGKPLVQSMVRCVGTPQPSCLKAKPGCDLSSTHCPCEFGMNDLPPLDYEYKFMAHEVLDAQVGSLENAAKDITLRHAGSERWLGVEARNKMVTAKANAGSLWHVALIGLGGGMLPQFLLKHSQDLSIDSVESSSDVIDVARAFFGVTQAESTGRLKVIPGEGLGFLQNSQVENYNSVIVDCFGDGRVPEGCRSTDFVQALYRALKPGSDALQNVIVRHPNNEKLDASNKQDFDALLNNYYAAFGKEAVTVHRGQGVRSTNAVIRARKP